MTLTLTQFLLQKYKETDDKSNMYGVGISDAEFRHFTMQYLLPDDWYITDPLGQSQINEIAICEILKKHSKQFRKERKHIKKRCAHVKH